MLVEQSVNNVTAAVNTVDNVSAENAGGSGGSGGGSGRVALWVVLPIVLVLMAVLAVLGYRRGWLGCKRPGPALLAYTKSKHGGQGSHTQSPGSRGLHRSSGSSDHQDDADVGDADRGTIGRLRRVMDSCCSAEWSFKTVRLVRQLMAAESTGGIKHLGAGKGSSAAVLGAVVVESAHDKGHAANHIEHHMESQPHLPQIEQQNVCPSSLVDD